MTDSHKQAWQPVLTHLLPALIQHPPKVLGISGAQGSGKSTLAGLLAQALNDAGITTAVLSLDDYYLTRAEREALAASIHPLCVTRGVPGTHDFDWLHRTLSTHLEQGESHVVELTVPRFDKGLDDRKGVEKVTADCLILEGWCLGVQAQPSSLISASVNDFEDREDHNSVWRTWCNDQIAQGYERVWELVQQWVYLRVPSFDQVYSWRATQEEQIPPHQRMSEAQLERFIAHYQRLTQWLLDNPFGYGPGIQVLLDAQHRVTQITPLEKEATE